MRTHLTDAVFAVDMNGQCEYVPPKPASRIRPGVSSRSSTGRGQPPYDHVAQSMALDKLRWIENQVARNRGGNAETTAHREHIRYQIRRGLDEPRA